MPSAGYILEKAFLAAGLLASGAYIMSSHVLPTSEWCAALDGARRSRFSAAARVRG
jgi:hypothetical protein